MLVESRYNVWAEAGTGAYVFNGVSGRTTRITVEQRARLETIVAGAAPIGPEDEPWLHELISSRSLIRDSYDELAMLKRRYDVARADPSHLGLTLVTSLGCNFDCPYCYEDKHPSILRPAVEDALVELLDQRAPTLRSMHVAWFGGEPLLGMRPLRSLSHRFIDRCDSAAIHYSASIVSNGSLLTEATCQELRALRVERVQVTLDGPPEVHDVRRPRKGGGSTFTQILDNLHHAVEHLQVMVRVNIDRQNLGSCGELVRILADAGLARRVTLYPAPLTFDAAYGSAPAGTYGGSAYRMSEFAEVEREFRAMAVSYGFSGESMPTPTSTPCTAVIENEWVVGAEGELWKCWDSVGNADEAVGTVFDLTATNNRLAKWLGYDPFSDADCRSCMALPVCMGGCPHHALVDEVSDHRCGTFRYNHQAKVASLAKWRELGIADEIAQTHTERSRQVAKTEPDLRWTPVSLTRRTAAAVP